MNTNGKSLHRSRPFLAVVLLLCLALVIALCISVIQLLLRQGQEVALSVKTSGDQFTESVTITVRNVLGMDILIDEQERSCAMLQYRDGKGWKDMYEIRFVPADNVALSTKYGGMYAHLALGGELHYELEGEQLEMLPGGEYRIAIRYISENEYIDYLQARAREIESVLDEAQENEASLPEDDDLPADGSVPQDIAESTLEDDPAQEEVSEEVTSPKTQVLYAEFIVISKADSSAD